MSDESLLMCSVEGCKELSSDKRSLANHLRFHERGQFPCTECPRTFSRKDNRDIHIKKKHGTTSTSPAPRDVSPSLPPAPKPLSPPPARIPSPTPLLSTFPPSSVSSPTSVANESVAPLPSLVASMQSAMTTVMHSFTSSIAAELCAAFQAVSRVDVPSPTATSSSTTKVDPHALLIRPKEAVIPSNTETSNVADRRATAMEKEIADLKEQLKEAKATSDGWKSKYEEAERQRGREAERQRGREAERQRGREAERQRGREAERQRGREAERQRGREAERQRGREAERQRGREAERQRGREAERQRGREAERQRGREAERQRGREAERQRGREAERQRGREAERQRGREAERQRGREAERQRGREAERLSAEAARGRVVDEKSATALQKEAAAKQKYLETVQADLAISQKALEQQQNQCKKHH